MSSHHPLALSLLLALPMCAFACGAPDDAAPAEPAAVDGAADDELPADEPPGDEVQDESDPKDADDAADDGDGAAGADDADGDEGDEGDEGDDADDVDGAGGVEVVAVDDGAASEDDTGGVAAQAAASGGRCVAYTTRHLQASMQHTDSVAQRRLAIDRAFHNPDGISPDTIGWTEIETQAQVDRINNRAGWSTYWPSGHPVVSGRNAVPISWKKSVYQFISGASHKASDGLAGVSPNRYVTRVRLRHKASGAIVIRVATHTVSAVDHPRDHVAYRLATHKKDIAMFNQVMQGAAFPVIGSGDFNTVHLRGKLRNENHGTQPYVFDVPAHGGSHGRNLLDWIVRRKSDGDAYRLKSVAFIDLSPSDHKGVRARYTFRPAPCR